MIKAKSKVYKHLKAKTLYVTLPSKLVTDNMFPLSKGDTVEIEIIDNHLIIKKVEI